MIINFSFHNHRLINKRELAIILNNYLLMVSPCDEFSYLKGLEQDKKAQKTPRKHFTLGPFTALPPKKQS